MDRDDDYLPGTPQREIAIRRRVRKIAEFYRHLLTYVVVIGLLFVMNVYMLYISEKPAHWSAWWVIWPALGWGIGLSVHGVTVLPMWGLFSQEWEDRKVKELLERERT